MHEFSPSPSQTPPEPSTPIAFDLEWGIATDVGLRRKNNEDTVFISPELNLAWLADGMGGYHAGEVASTLAVKTAHDHMAYKILAQTATPAEDWAQNSLLAAAEQAHQRVALHAKTHAECEGMGTTLVGAWFFDQIVHFIHVGDSRLYCWHPQPGPMLSAQGQFLLLTRDHTILQERTDAGLTPPPQAQRQMRHVLTHALGIEGVFHADVGQHSMRLGDIYLLCSDGLTDALPDYELAQLCHQPWPSMQDLAQHLVLRANQEGGRDNISVIIVHAKSQSTVKPRHIRQ